MGKHLLTLGALALLACFVAGIIVSRQGFDLKTKAADLPLDSAAQNPALDEGAGGAVEGSPLPDQAPEGSPEPADLRPPEPQGGIAGIPEDLDISLDQAILDDGRYVISQPDGRRIVLTLDPEIQSTLEELFARYEIPHAGFVAIEARTGRVLALVSAESADPIGDVALKAMAPSASIFKIITAAALIEGKGYDPNEKVCVPDGPAVPTTEDILGIGAPNTSCMNLGTAFGMSNNYVFARLAHKHLSASDLQTWAARFAYNEPLPFNLTVEASRAEISDDPVLRARTAAGFWNTTLSPLHGALLAATVANGGVMMRPNLIENILNPDGEAVYAFKAVPYKKVMEPETARAIADLMVYSTTVGTASSHLGQGFPEGYVVAGKTGTLSQNKPYLMFSWFVGFAPIDKPKVAVSVLLCNPAKWRIKSTFAAAQGLKILAERDAPKPDPSAAPDAPPDDAAVLDGDPALNEAAAALDDAPPEEDAPPPQDQ